MRTAPRRCSQKATVLPSDPTNSDTTLYETTTSPGPDAAPLAGLTHIREPKSGPASGAPAPDHFDRLGRRLDFTVRPSPDALGIAVRGDLDIATSYILVREVIRRLHEHDGVFMI